MRLAVLYEHAEWFTPLFAAIDARGVACRRILATELTWDPLVPPDFDLLFNRMSPSAWTRGHARALLATAAYLDYVESWGVPVVNGSAAWRLEVAKTRQIDLFRRLGVSHPRARAINDPSAAVGAASGLRFPVVVKPNIGGSGAGIQRFDSPDALDAAVRSGKVDLGLDSTALVQEFLPAGGGSITRIELLAGEFLYAIRITPPAGHGFNLCPADICQEGDAEAPRAVPEICPAKPAMQISATDVPREIVATAERIAREAGLDVCGIEFLVDERDGRPYFYDVNALSNFVTNAPAIVGFDPFEPLVDLLEARLEESLAARV